MTENYEQLSLFDRDDVSRPALRKMNIIPKEYWDTMFDYLDWCQEQGITNLEDTESHGLAMQFGRMRHDVGLPFDGLHLAVCQGRVFA